MQEKYPAGQNRRNAATDGCSESVRQDHSRPTQRPKGAAIHSNSSQFLAHMV